MKRIFAYLTNHLTATLTTLMAAALILYAYGCESTVKSMINPSQSVDRRELQGELDYLLAQAESRFATLDKKDALKRELFNQFLIATDSGKVNPQGIFAAIIGALGIGALINNAKLRIHNSVNGKNAVKNSLGIITTIASNQTTPTTPTNTTPPISSA